MILFNVWLILLTFVFPPGPFNKLTYVWIAIIGSSSVLISLIYYLRRCRFFNTGQLRYWLTGHVYTATVGVFMVLFHSRWEFDSLIPTLTFIAAEITVLTGALTRFALGNEDQAKTENSPPVVTADEKLLALLSAEKMRYWRLIHQYSAAAVFSLLLVHIFSRFYFGLQL